MLHYKSDAISTDASRIRQAKADFERDREAARATGKKFPRRITKVMIANRAGVSAEDVRHYEWLERQYPSIVAMNISLGEMGVEFFKTRTSERAMGILPPKLHRRRPSEIQLDTIRRHADRLGAMLHDLLSKNCPSRPCRNAELDHFPKLPDRKRGRVSAMLESQRRVIYDESSTTRRRCNA